MSLEVLCSTHPLLKARVDSGDTDTMRWVRCYCAMWVRMGRPSTSVAEAMAKNIPRRSKSRKTQPNPADAASAISDSLSNGVLSSTRSRQKRPAVAGAVDGFTGKVSGVSPTATAAVDGSAVLLALQDLPHIPPAPTSAPAPAPAPVPESPPTVRE